MRARLLILLLLTASLGLTATARAQVLYWLDTNYATPSLHKVDLNGNGTSVGLPTATLPEGLATSTNGKIYWCEASLSGSRVQRAAPTLAGITTLVSGGSAMRGVAVDDVAGRIYWTSSNLVSGSRITRSALDGTGVTILNALGSTQNPRGIAVDHAGGKIYWADFNGDALYRANLDGTVMELWQVLPSGSKPYGVAVDPVGHGVYWTEYSGKIRRVPTGGGATTTLIGGLSNPTYIALNPASGVMYWAEGGAGAQHLYSGPMGGGSRTQLALPLTTYGGLAFQPNATVDTPLEETMPREFALSPLSPNPSSGPVHTEFSLPREARVRLTVIDLQGREVSVLVDGTLPAGRHGASWNTNTGRRQPAGVYFVRMAVDGRSWSRRLVLTP